MLVWMRHAMKTASTVYTLPLAFNDPLSKTWIASAT